MTLWAKKTTKNGRHFNAKPIGQLDIVVLICTSVDHLMTETTCLAPLHHGA